MKHAQVERAGADPLWRMLSRTGEYALRVVLHLAEQDAGELTSATGAAAALHIPERYTARVLNELARHGVVTSVRGAHGGFRLAQPAELLTLAHVLAPFDAVGEAPQCLLRQQLCGAGEPCIAHAQWQGVAGQIRSFFQATTVADMLASQYAAMQSAGE